jgi:hypothetical protein
MATAEERTVVRTLIPDSEAVFGEAENETLFSDPEIDAFVIAGGNNLLRAAGLANLAIATSEALISKKIRTQDLQTDGPAVADALIKKAKELFALAAKQEDLANSDYFDIVNFREGWGTYPPELTEWNWNY